jgi:hypothetical protein
VPPSGALRFWTDFGDGIDSNRLTAMHVLTKEETKPFRAVGIGGSGLSCSNATRDCREGGQ